VGSTKVLQSLYGLYAGDILLVTVKPLGLQDEL